MKTLITCSAALALALFLFAGSAAAYDSYEMFGSAASCVDCHSGFISKGPLHDLHVGNSQMTNTCKLCHTNSGDIPRTWTSGVVDGQGCRGCHGRDNGPGFTWGAGLRAHHANAGAPADKNGQFCADCHTGDPALTLPESTVPVYYLRADVDVKDPCAAALPTGEDYDGDGKGLDNDGDLLYDNNDSDCVSTGVFAGRTPSPPISISIYPNPVTNGSATIWYEIGSRSDVSVKIYDVAGHLVEENHFSGLIEGPHTQMFSGRDRTGRALASGVYLVRIQAGETVAVGRIVLLK